ncbi:MAG: adenine nucleotide alpha hydrolase family protein [Bacteroidales bacterium]|nr:adenine nucleotide alpha hydrolase family protein [Bacteroidales bacterium]
MSSQRKTHDKLQRIMGRTLRQYPLIEPGDKILIALSGGKDSLALMDLLGERMKRSQGGFELAALHVRMPHVGYSTDADYLRKQADKWGIPFHLKVASFPPDTNEKRSPCFLCAWNRRKVLFDEAQKMGFRKIAFGHHQDDLIQTALLNLTFAGSFNTMPVLLKMRKFDMTLIRPMAAIPENLLKEWAALQNYQPLIKTCPHETQGNRLKMKQLAEQMERLNPDYRHSIWHAMEKSGILIEEMADNEENAPSF